MSLVLKSEGEPSYLNLVSSILVLRDLVFNYFYYANQTAYHIQYLMTASLGTSIEMNNVIFEHSNIQIAYLIDSVSSLTNVSINNISVFSNFDNLIYLDNSNLSVLNSTWR